MQLNAYCRKFSIPPKQNEILQADGLVGSYFPNLLYFCLGLNTLLLGLEGATAIGQNPQVKDQSLESDIGCVRLDPFGTLACIYKLQNNSQKDGVPVFDLGQWAAFQTQPRNSTISMLCKISSLMLLISLEGVRTSWPITSETSFVLFSS